MTTALYTHPDGLLHVNPPGHPEQVARLKAIEAALSAPGFDKLDRREAPLGQIAAIKRAHPLEYIEIIRDNIPDEGWVQIDPDTALSPGSFVSQEITAESVKTSVTSGPATISGGWSRPMVSGPKILAPPKKASGDVTLRRAHKPIRKETARTVNEDARIRYLTALLMSARHPAGRVIRRVSPAGIRPIAPATTSGP